MERAGEYSAWLFVSLPTGARTSDKERNDVGINSRSNPLLFFRKQQWLQIPPDFYLLKRKKYWDFIWVQLAEEDEIQL